MMADQLFVVLDNDKDAYDTDGDCQSGVVFDNPAEALKVLKSIGEVLGPSRIYRLVPVEIELAVKDAE